MKITNEDNMILMARYPNNHFDLAIVDPPYGIDVTNMEMGSSTHNGKKYTSTAKKAKFSKGSGKLKNGALNKMSLGWDVKPTKEYFDQLFRVSKNQIIWGGNYFDLPPTRCIICWDKVQPWDNFSQWEMAWTSFNKSADMVRISTTGGNNKEKKFHPTQKPVTLFEYLTKTYSNENEVVLDFCMGSGTTGVACQNLNRQFIGIELDESYFNIAKERIENVRDKQNISG